jgi:hypothetical protein
MSVSTISFLVLKCILNINNLIYSIGIMYIKINLFSIILYKLTNNFVNII